jgi:transcriptional regulator with XRE-family HTH domain
MNLRDYLHFERITQADFAKMIGVSRFWMSRVTNGDMPPGKKLAKLIEEKTGGKVTKEEMLFPEDYK